MLALIYQQSLRLYYKSTLPVAQTLRPHFHSLAYGNKQRRESPPFTYGFSVFQNFGIPEMAHAFTSPFPSWQPIDYPSRLNTFSIN
jgi:hypothetical protein